LTARDFDMVGGVDVVGATQAAVMARRPWLDPPVPISSVTSAATAAAQQHTVINRPMP
jgi:hypothetical protein